MSTLDDIRSRAEAATEGPWEENWLDIPGYDGYQVSDFGNVRSFFKKGNHKHKLGQEARTLKLVNNRGYRTVSLPMNGKYRHRGVHGLVMLAFSGPRPDGQEVAHLNGQPSDNRRENLAYVTHVENESHKVAHGTNGLGERNSRAVLQGWQVAEIKFLAGKSVPQGKIASLFDISHKTVNEVLCGIRWSSEPARTDVPKLVAALRAAESVADRMEEFTLRTNGSWARELRAAITTALGEE